MEEKNEAPKSDKIEFDEDATQKTWDECYKKIYKVENWDFWGKFNFENLKQTYNQVHRFYAPIIINEEYQQFNQYQYFAMSGDTDFNFKRYNKRNKKYEKFENLLQRDYQGNDLKVQLYKLEECYNRYQNLENYSLMPISGGLQLIKQNCDNDRFDAFVHTLNKYYKTGMLDHARERNKEALETYLELFDGINDFCSKIYMISCEDFVNKIIRQGSEPIDNGASVVRYMQLAEEFWDNKKRVLKNANYRDVR